MTVRELRELLMKLDDKALIVEERGGEHKIVEARDIGWCAQIFNANTGEVEGGEFEYIVFGAWS